MMTPVIDRNQQTCTTERPTYSSVLLQLLVQNIEETKIILLHNVHCVNAIYDKKLDGRNRLLTQQQHKRCIPDHSLASA